MRSHISISKVGVLFAAPSKAEAWMITRFPVQTLKGMTEVGEESKTKVSLINAQPLP